MASKVCLGANGTESQLIFNDGIIKSRIIKKDTNWYTVEWKYVDETKLTHLGDKVSMWLWWLCGTKEWLNLSEQELAWCK